MSEKMLMSLHEEIVKIRQLLEITFKNDLMKELEKILTTKERKTVWALSDGSTDTKAIAEKTGISIRAVQQTVKELQEADYLIIERRGFPERKFDYVPPEWKLKERG
jgi:DNA-binding MarR family transcriptional regulator